MDHLWVIGNRSGVSRCAACGLVGGRDVEPECHGELARPMTATEVVPREMLTLLGEREAEIVRLRDALNKTYENFNQQLGYDHSIYGRAWKFIEGRGAGKHVVVALCDEIERMRAQIAEREAKDRRLYGPFPNARQRAERAVASLDALPSLDPRLGKGTT